MEIKDKVAVVTGGSKGIGFAVAEALLKKGAKVLICGRSAADLKTAASWLSAYGRVETETCDERSETQVRLMLEKAEHDFGGIDILINNAGMGVMGRTVEEISGDDFRQTLETNLFGVFYACHHVIPMMKQRGGGYIINISSLAGQNPHPGMAAYNASKFGLNGFTEAMMQEVRADDIKVSLICPGSVNTNFGGGHASEEADWKLQPADIAQTVIDLLEMNANALPSKVEMRPSKPPKK